MEIPTKKVRIKRVAQMNAILEELYPNAQIELIFKTDFECFVAVLLSAQCTDLRVNQVTKKLFNKYKTIHAFAIAKQLELEKDVFSCGFYRNKARNIIAAAQKVEKEFDGKLPRTLAEFITLPGAARKTANVVLSTLYGITEGIAVDTHVRRFALRFDLTDYKDPLRIEKDLMEIMPKSQWWSFNHRLVHYGRHCCKAHTHDCTNHPLTKIFTPANAIWPKAH